MPVFSVAKEHGVSLSDALREAATHAPAEATVIYTYEFVAPTITPRALVVVGYDNLQAYDENNVLVTYIGIAGLRAEGPEESDSAATPLLRLRLDGVSQEIVERLNQALVSLTPIEIVERIYISGDLLGPAVIPPLRAYIREGDIDESTVTIEAGFGDPANQPFPKKLYTREQHPGLVP